MPKHDHASEILVSEPPGPSTKTENPTKTGIPAMWGEQKIFDDNHTSSLVGMKLTKTLNPKS